MNKEKYFKVYLYVFGTLNVLTAFSIPMLFGNQLLWQPRNFPTDLMVGCLYFAMGIIMLLVSKTPMKHKAFVDFIIIGNILHSSIMLAYAQTLWHIVLDASFIGAMGLIPLVLYPWGLKTFLRY